VTTLSASLILSLGNRVGDQGSIIFRFWCGTREAVTLSGILEARLDELLAWVVVIVSLFFIIACLSIYCLQRSKTCFFVA
jgi:hypothetical protein